MDFVTMAVSSVGNVKEVNQDYYFFEQGRTERGNIVFAILCDGMGGLQQGEFASKTVVEAFKAWGKEHLPDYSLGEFVDAEIRREWTELVNRCNQYLHAYGRERGISLGTTLTDGGAILYYEYRGFPRLCFGSGHPTAYKGSYRGAAGGGSGKAFRLRCGKGFPAKYSPAMHRGIGSDLSGFLLRRTGAKGYLSALFGRLSP